MEEAVTAHNMPSMRRAGVVDEQINVDNLGPDGVGDTRADTDSTGEFEDGGEEHGLEVADRAGRDRRRPGVAGHRSAHSGAEK